MLSLSVAGRSGLQLDPAIGQRVHHLVDGERAAKRAIAIQRAKASVRVHEDIDRDLGFIVAHAHWLGPSSQAPDGGQQAQGGAAAVAPLSGRTGHAGIARMT